MSRDTLRAAPRLHGGAICGSRREFLKAVVRRRPGGFLAALATAVLAVLLAALPGPVGVAAAGREWTALAPGSGTVVAWGKNDGGQLGDGTLTSRREPAPVGGLDDVVATAGGNRYSLALKADGTVWAWGDNDAGQLGSGDRQPSTTPVRVGGLDGVTAIASGGYFGLALKEDGTVWAWGYNGESQLGGSLAQSHCAAGYSCSHTPIRVAGLGPATAVAAGLDHSLALRDDGTVWTWRLNSQGQLGDGTTTSSSTPVRVSGLAGVTNVAGGSLHSLALKANGTVWFWGVNALGVGSRDTLKQVSPTKVAGLKGAIAIESGSSHSLALTAAPAADPDTLPATGQNPGLPISAAVGAGTVLLLVGLAARRMSRPL